MLTPLDIARLIRTELQRARSMAAALTRNIGQVLDNADRIIPFALTRFDDLLADDILRLLGCLQRAHELHNRLNEAQVLDLALGHGGSDLGEDQIPATAARGPALLTGSVA